MNWFCRDIARWDRFHVSGNHQACSRTYRCQIDSSLREHICLECHNCTRRYGSVHPSHKLHNTDDCLHIDLSRGQKKNISHPFSVVTGHTLETSTTTIDTHLTRSARNRAEGCGQRLTLPMDTLRAKRTRRIALMIVCLWLDVGPGTLPINTCLVVLTWRITNQRIQFGLLP